MQSKSDNPDGSFPSIPVKAIRKSALKTISKISDPSSPAEPSCHTVSFCEFTNSQGVLKKGFFKPVSVEENYRESLAKFAVAMSAFMRLSLGERAAEDLLVFDDKGQIAGTFSLALPGFKPLAGDADYTRLLKHNILELMFFSYTFNQDDLHRNNISEVGLIDWDMGLWWINQYIKRRRGNPGNAPNFDVENFTNMLVTFNNQGWSPIHWPGYWIPGNGNIWKQFPNWAQFKKLEENPELIDPNSGTVITTAQQQLYTAALKFILSFQPDVLRNQLVDLFGDMPFDFESLDRAAADDLKNNLPKYCNADTNKGSFVDVLMVIYQDIYDEVYRKLMLYPGGKNSKGVVMPSFRDFLLQNPQAFQEVNEEMTARKDEMTARFSAAKKRDYFSQPDAPSRAFNTELIQQRYHQFWQHVFFNDVEQLLEKSTALTSKVLKDLKIELKATGLPVDKTAMTKALPALQANMLEGNAEEIIGLIGNDSAGEYYDGSVRLIRFHTQLQQLVKVYFAIPPEKLTIDDNRIFIGGLSALYQEGKMIPGLLADPWREQFSEIWKAVHSLHIEIDLDIHLEAKASKQKTEALVDTHTLQVTKESCVKSLFAWLKTQSAAEFEKLVDESIVEYQKKGNVLGSVLGSRSRAPAVQDYIKNTRCLTSDFRCARILLDEEHQKGDFNRYLVRRCIQAMVQKAIPGEPTSFPAVKKAIQMDKFASEAYQNEAIIYAGQQPEYTDLLNAKMQDQVINIFYDWIASYPRNQLEALSLSADKEYCSKWVGSTARKGEVSKLFKEAGKPETVIIATIFSDGGTDKSSLNYKLMAKLMPAIREDVIKSEEKRQNPSYQMLLSLEEKHYPDYLKALKTDSVSRIKAGENKPAVPEAVRSKALEVSIF